MQSRRAPNLTAIDLWVTSTAARWIAGQCIKRLLQRYRHCHMQHSNINARSGESMTAHPPIIRPHCNDYVTFDHYHYRGARPEFSVQDGS